jgi:hypothetical protein
MKLPGMKGAAAVKLPDAAKEFRSIAFEKFRNLLIAGSSSALSRDLTRLIEAPQDQNVLPIIRATRHAMFHGVLSPGSMGFSSRRGHDFLEQLAQGLFVEMDRLWERYLSNQPENNDSSGLYQR